MSEKTTRLRLTAEHLRILNTADGLRPIYNRENTLSKRALYVIEEYETLYDRVLKLEAELRDKTVLADDAEALKEMLNHFLKNENGTV